MNKKILVVDDEPDIRFTLKELLTFRGFDVDEAADGESALEKIAALPYDLVFLDLMMPRSDGHEVLRRLTPAFHEHTHVVLLTAKGEDDDILQGYHEGATYYITKPFKYQRVFDITRYLLEASTEEEKEAFGLKL